MFARKRIQCIEWPACSSDLFDRECLKTLRLNIKAKTLPLLILRDLEIAILEQRNRIRENLIDNVSTSMESRCATVLSVRDVHTPYKNSFILFKQNFYCYLQISESVPYRLFSCSWYNIKLLVHKCIIW